MRINYARKFSIFIMWLLYVLYNFFGDRTDTGLCELLRSIRLNCQLMTKFEMMHILQHRCAAVLAHTQDCHIKK